MAVVNGRYPGPYKTQGKSESLSLFNGTHWSRRHDMVIVDQLSTNWPQNGHESEGEEPRTIDTERTRGPFCMCESRPERTYASARNRYEVHIVFQEGNHERQYFES